MRAPSPASVATGYLRDILDELKENTTQTAPVEHHERAEFQREHERTWPFPATSGPATQADHQKCKAIRLEGWQTRAALKRKPS